MQDIFLKLLISGAPFYLLCLATLKTLFWFVDTVWLFTFFSAFCATICVVLVKRIICFTAQKSLKILKPIWVSLSGYIGALSLAFSTSFWTAATEVEVYTLSTLCFLLITFCGLKAYYEETTQAYNKQLLFINFLLGLGVGIHPINNAIIIPLVALLYTRKANSFFMFIKGLFWVYSICICHIL